MNIILCNKSSFPYFQDYIYSITNILKAKILLFEDNININFTKNNNYIFIQSIDKKLFKYIENNTNFYLINTEQLSVEKSKMSINSYPKNINMIDYINTNFKYYDNKYNKYLLPYQINHCEIFKTNKQKNVCLIGTINNIPSNRQNIINLLKQKNINVDIISGFNTARDVNLFKYKIILNIGYYPDNCKVIETFRCDRCIYNKMIVVSDMKDNIEEYYLKEHIIFTDYNNIPDKVIEVINNYDEYYNKLFSKLNIEEINCKLYNLSKNLIDNINLGK